MSDPLDALRELAATWHEEAAMLRRRGADPQADTLESAAEDLEGCLREWSLELLSLEEAAREVGCSYDTIQRKVGREIPNAGEKGSPRVRRCDLHPWIDRPELEGLSPVDELADETLRARARRGG